MSFSRNLLISLLFCIGLSRCICCTWIRQVDNLVHLYPRERHDLGVGAELQDAPEVGHETDHVLLDGQVHVDNVLDRQVAVIKRERIRAKSEKEKETNSDK